jgi:hypothetical protein
LPPEAVEIVDEKTAHKRLQGLVDVPNGHALLNNFVAVHIHKLLGNACEKRRAKTGNFRTFPRGSQKGLQIRRQKLNLPS